MMPSPRRALAVTLLPLAFAAAAQAQNLTAAGQPAQLDIRPAGEHSIRITLKPVSYQGDAPFSPAIAERAYPAPVVSLRSVPRPVRQRVGSMQVEVTSSPLTVNVSTADGRPVQRLTFGEDGSLTFTHAGQPVLGMGEGGPRPVRGGAPWREQPVEFNRLGRLHEMVPRWQSDMYGSRNPVAMLVGTEGWGLFVATPWVQVDLTKPNQGTFIPWKPTGTETGPQTEANQQQNLGKGIHPVDSIVPGLYDLFVFDGRNPEALLKDFSVITGPAALPPKGALGFMQSHRTLDDETQMLGVIDGFRSRNIPLDAVIYLGTGFSPRGWNTRQPSFDFHPEVFKRDPKQVLADMHARNVKVVVHMVPWDRDRLPTLHGTIPPEPGETVDESHILSYWRQHVPLVEAGVDAFWPDEGDWFNLFERIKRHQLYYQGHLYTEPDERPWSLQRNGFPGIAQWGGWVWSGDTETSWKTLEAQIAVGQNYGLSIGPYWGSDIGGFYPNQEFTGELMARWFQFGAFSGSFRTHGRAWWLRLPWGFGGSTMGPLEIDNRNSPPTTEAQLRRVPLESELNNPAIEPVIKQYTELRYQLLPYTYTLAWEARATGLPLQRALWVHYPGDERVRVLHDQYLWGRDLLIAPVYQKGATSREVYLPRGAWYDWWTNDRVEGGRTVTRAVDLATMPIYVRAGAIIPVDPVRQYVAQPVTAPTTLRVYRGADGQFTLYDDDGITQEYLQSRGSWTRMTWNDAARTLTLEPGAPAGASNVVAPRTFTVQLLPEGTTRTVQYNGQRVAATF
jgi:alpha-glucosidase/alpha-D-xyloside xylohydrolase